MSKRDDLRVGIIDFHMGNLFSVKNACEHVGITPIITSDKNALEDYDALILPGVGAFGDAVKNLREMDLTAALKDFISSGKPFFGICLGMQLLFSESEEFGFNKGLDIIKGSVVKFSGIPQMKVPQICWNGIFIPEGRPESYWENTPCSGIRNGEYMYFLHSFYCVPEQKELIFSETTYAGVRYCSSLKKGNVFAAQFHPEKSASAGIRIYKNWVNGLITGKQLKEISKT